MADPGMGKPVAGRQADAPSIGLESTHSGDGHGELGSDQSGNESGDDQTPDWMTANDSDVAQIEACRVRENHAENAYKTLASRRSG